MQALIYRLSVALLTFTIGLSLTWLCTSPWHSSTSVTKKPSAPPVALVNLLGEKLALWSQVRGKNILIDGKAINYVSHFEWLPRLPRKKPGCGLPVRTYTIGWDSLSNDAHPSPEWENLRDSLVKSECDEKTLTALIEKLPVDNSLHSWWPQNSLADALSCLGKISFESVKDPATPKVILPF